MLKKSLFTVMLVTCVAVLPSYTNTCARPDANFLKTASLKDNNCAAVDQPIRKAAHGLEVFPLGLISIQL